MNGLRLRVSLDMRADICSACDDNDLNISSFCRRVGRQVASGRIKVKNVGKKKKYKSPTKSTVLRIDDWPFPDIKGKKLVAAIDIALKRLESVPAIKKPVIHEIEGLDYILAEN